MLGTGHSKAEPAEFNARNKCSERTKFIDFNCGLALALRQGHVFGYVNELNSGLPLALSPGQARIINLLDLLNSLYSTGLALALARQKPTELSELSKFDKLTNLNRALPWRWAKAKLQGLPNFNHGLPLALARQSQPN